ncbi:MAG: hypothetical protein WDO18_19220 [Acidobacteriota bacterium]
MPDLNRVSTRALPAFTAMEDLDPLAPQREAALFYGLFLRGHSADTLRRDIDVPKKLHDKMLRRHQNEARVQEKLNRSYVYRKKVLAIFDELVTRQGFQRIQ